MNPLLSLNKLGQFVWLDAMSRDLIVSGRLARFMEADGVGGITSNPTIFDKAITGSKNYDATIRRALNDDSTISERTLAEHIVVEDIQMAADVLRTVYDNSNGANGYVSIEVPPHTAHDAAATMKEARRLWQLVSRPNVMIKVPATAAGVHAVEALTAEGINVNITLMFSRTHYDAVAHAYLNGIARNPAPARVVSVASIFVSRLDVAADRQLEQIGSREALSLRGFIAIANARRIYAFRPTRGTRFAITAARASPWTRTTEPQPQSWSARTLSVSTCPRLRSG